MVLTAPAYAADTEPVFASTVSPISPELLATMRGVTWHDGCPVAAEALRYLRLSHWDYQGQVRTGELVVHRDAAPDVVAAFAKMFAMRFPVEKMRLIDAYGGSDAKSMQDNNTSGFNCRWVTGQKGVFSHHSYGWAVDINPRTNPLVKGTHFAPPNAQEYLDRHRDYPGVLNAGSAVVRVWKAMGWTWGGDWPSPKDYQHVEKPLKSARPQP